MCSWAGRPAAAPVNHWSPAGGRRPPRTCGSHAPRALAAPAGCQTPAHRCWAPLAPALYQGRGPRGGRGTRVLAAAGRAAAGGEGRAGCRTGQRAPSCLLAAATAGRRAPGPPPCASSERQLRGRPPHLHAQAAGPSARHVLDPSDPALAGSALAAHLLVRRQSIVRCARPLLLSSCCCRAGCGPAECDLVGGPPGAHLMLSC